MNYSGIDLHSNNSVVSVIDETDRVIAERRLPNDLAKILAFLAPWQAELAGVVVESPSECFYIALALPFTLWIKTSSPIVIDLITFVERPLVAA